MPFKPDLLPSGQCPIAGHLTEIQFLWPRGGVRECGILGDGDGLTPFVTFIAYFCASLGARVARLIRTSLRLHNFAVRHAGIFSSFVCILHDLLWFQLAACEPHSDCFCSFITHLTHKSNMCKCFHFICALIRGAHQMPWPPLYLFFPGISLAKRMASRVLRRRACKRSRKACKICRK